MFLDVLSICSRAIEYDLNEEKYRLMNMPTKLN
jgi:hypothetical protein